MEPSPSIQTARAGTAAHVPKGLTRVGHGCAGLTAALLCGLVLTFVILPRCSRLLRSPDRLYWDTPVTEAQRLIALHIVEGMSIDDATSAMSSIGVQMGAVHNQDNSQVGSIHERSFWKLATRSLQVMLYYDEQGTLLRAEVRQYYTGP